MLPSIPGCSSRAQLPQSLHQWALPSTLCLKSCPSLPQQSIPMPVLPLENSGRLQPTPETFRIGGTAQAASAPAIAETTFANAPASSWHTQIRQYFSETAQSYPGRRVERSKSAQCTIPSEPPAPLLQAARISSSSLLLLNSFEIVRFTPKPSRSICRATPLRRVFSPSRTP